ncbi:Uncharacterised protein [Edwardsiella hoshinae]|uniref:Uncharacterized protein n=1 Tax=Edwardsiella hoshinae TaxID=93378 RepID=A0A376DAN6_9GAMM|nr:Uncharacterised protein [Edwardsiella hoshinae]
MLGIGAAIVRVCLVSVGNRMYKRLDGVDYGATGCCTDSQ